jgi:dienelactone hydrolase
MNRLNILVFTFASALLFNVLFNASVSPASAADSLPALRDEQIPQNLDQLWAGYDPDKEPLEVEVIHQWQQDDTTVQMLTYAIGTFKGKPARMGAYYAFPTNAKGKIPAILQMHGGGQRASREMAEAAAANGYACISINWGGKAMADQQPNEAGTDWGAVDATQTTHNGHYSSLKPDDKTIDSVVSPRNNNWFLIVLAARRALTFLQQQPVVDPDRLGVTGHSMGGKLTVMVAGVDSRVKAAVPSCGGAAAAPQELRDRPGSSCRPVNREPLYHKTIDDLNSIRRITCPILYTGPHNDFNGNFDNLFANWKEMPSKSKHFSISPHLNHRHISESTFAGKHFFDTILKGESKFPATPKIEVALKTESGIPKVTVSPSAPNEVVKVDIYYSVDPHALTRFWRTAPSIKTGGNWTANCPVISSDMPLIVIANVYYPLKKEIVGPRWNRKSPETFVVSSEALDFDPQLLKKAGVKPTDKSERTLEANFDSWQDWFRLEIRNNDHRQCVTRKLKDPKWRGPNGATLAIDVLDPAGGEIAVTFEMNSWNAYSGINSGKYYAAKPIEKSADWQTVELSLEDLKPLDAKSPTGLRSWQYMTTLGIVAHVRVRKDGESVIVAGSRWPQDRQLRNLRWVGGTYPKTLLLPGQKISQEEFDKIFNSEIDKSVQQEERDANDAKKN